MYDIYTPTKRVRDAAPHSKIVHILSLNYTTKAPACQLELCAKNQKQIFGNLLQKRGKYGIIVCVCVTSIHVFHGWSAASLCMNTPDFKEAK